MEMLRKYVGKFVLPLLVTAAIGCSDEGPKSYQSNLPNGTNDLVTNSAKQKIFSKVDSLYGVIFNYSEQARNQLGNSLEDLEFDLEEQRELWSTLQERESKISELEESVSSIESFKKDSLKSVEWYELYGLINENLRGVDFGSPELETFLKEQKLPVKVTPYGSSGDTIAICAGLLAFCLISLYVDKSL